MSKLQLIYGTGNQAKLGAMKRRLASLPVEIIGLPQAMEALSPDQRKVLEDIVEDGKSPLENARKKAHTYYRVLQKPVFSCDTGLYLEGIPEELQPGIHVRTVGGRSMTDQEMAEYYSGLAKKYGDLPARYWNAICLILGERQEYASMDESLASARFLLTSKPHPRPGQPGFPLDRYSKDLKTGEYFYDLGEEETDQVAVEEGFLAFFRKVLCEVNIGAKN